MLGSVAGLSSHDCNAFPGNANPIPGIKPYSNPQARSDLPGEATPRTLNCSPGQQARGSFVVVVPPVVVVDPRRLRPNSVARSMSVWFSSPLACGCRSTAVMVWPRTAARGGVSSTLSLLVSSFAYLPRSQPRPAGTLSCCRCPARRCR